MFVQYVDITQENPSIDKAVTLPASTEDEANDWFIAQGEEHATRMGIDPSTLRSASIQDVAPGLAMIAAKLNLDAVMFVGYPSSDGETVELISFIIASDGERSLSADIMASMIMTQLRAQGIIN